MSRSVSLPLALLLALWPVACLDTSGGDDDQAVVGPVAPAVSEAVEIAALPTWPANGSQISFTVGPLAVRWAQDSASQFHLQVISPAGTSGEVWVPLLSGGGTSTALSVGATLLRRSGNYDVYRVAAGTFEFSSAP